MFDPRGPTFFELARQALSSTTKGYDLLAEKFEYTPFRTPDEVLIPLAEKVGPPASIRRALDLCCGTGAALWHLRSRCREEVVGIDLSEGMLAVAERRLREAPGTAEVVLEKGDALDLKYRERFDVITSVGAFGHILEPQQEGFCQAVYRALVPGGRFLFLTAPMPPFFSRAHLISRGFNGVMHVRNLLIKPPFIMFYLTFPLERAREVLTEQGFEVEEERPFNEGPFQSLVLVEARRPC